MVLNEAFLDKNSHMFVNFCKLIEYFHLKGLYLDYLFLKYNLIHLLIKKLTLLSITFSYQVIELICISLFSLFIIFFPFYSFNNRRNSLKWLLLKVYLLINGGVSGALI